jgi:hypothetical protein
MAAVPANFCLVYDGVFEVLRVFSISLSLLFTYCRGVRSAKALPDSALDEPCRKIWQPDLPASQPGGARKSHKAMNGVGCRAP